jgi:methionyl aminopeptidase
MQPGGRLSDIGAAVQGVVEAAGFSVVREYTGHGIGMAMHEDPDIPNWGRPGKGRKLGPGQTYAVEPMVCMGRADTELLEDDWTVVTADGSWAAHTEHTIAITEHGPEILTRP